MMLVLISMVLNVEHVYDFGTIKAGLIPIDSCGWFQWYFRYWLGRRPLDDERQINRWKKKIASSFKGKLN